MKDVSNQSFTRKTISMKKSLAKKIEERAAMENRSFANMVETLLINQVAL